MNTDIDSNVRIEAVTTYFKKVDARDPTVLDLFTDDVQMFFPKFDLAHGKTDLVKFSEIMTSYLASIDRDIEAFNPIVSSNFIADPLAANRRVSAVTSAGEGIRDRY